MRIRVNSARTKRNAKTSGNRRKRILIGVTIDDSLQFHTGLPEALVADGWEVHVVAGPGRRLEALSRVSGVSVHALPMEREPHLSRDAIALWRWLKLIRSIRPDVTFIGTPKAALLGNVSAWALRVPFRSYELLGLRLETSAGPRRALLRTLERLTARSAHEVVAVSKSLQQLALDLDITTPDRIVVLGSGSCNGVDVQRFRDISTDRNGTAALFNELGLDERIPVIGFVGRLTRDKGLPELAGALRLLCRKGVNVQLLVVGSVDDDSGRVALELLHRTGQEVVLAGYREDVAPFYALMDIFCLPSLREGLPNVVLESMASRTAVVATDATGIVDLIENSVSGYIVPRGSETELARALAEAISDGSKSQTMVETAFEMVETRFDTGLVQQRIRGYFLRKLAEAATHGSTKGGITPSPQASG